MDFRIADTFTDSLARLAGALARPEPQPYDYELVDETQDVSVAQLRFLTALGAERPNGLFFAGDLGQRIFQPPFSWLSLGVDIRGRSRTLQLSCHGVVLTGNHECGPRQPPDLRPDTAISPYDDYYTQESLFTVQQYDCSPHAGLRCRAAVAGRSGVVLNVPGPSFFTGAGQSDDLRQQKRDRLPALDLTTLLIRIIPQTLVCREEDDEITSRYRNHGHCGADASIWCGGDSPRYEGYLGDYFDG